MTLGLTPEGYAVYWTPSTGSPPTIAAISGSLLFFKGFLDAVQAAQDFMDAFAADNGGSFPQYVWIESLSRYWNYGVKQ